MNRNDFLNLMESTEPIDPKKTADIGEIVAIFPYFHSAHLLLLKGLHNNSDVRFGNQLRNSAIHLADRDVLYNYLFKQNNPLAGDHVVSSQDNSTVETQDFASLPDPEEAQNHDIVETQDFASLHDTPQDDKTGETQDVASLQEILELDADGIVGVADEPAEESQEPPVLSQADLIDRFIIANPRIEPVRDKKEISMEDRSERQESEGFFVTETLAGIYITQGYYSKAIDIFERLILKYPEKSSYFATQIEKVKEYLKK